MEPKPVQKSDPNAGIFSLSFCLRDSRREVGLFFAPSAPVSCTDFSREPSIFSLAFPIESPESVTPSANRLDAGLFPENITWLSEKKYTISSSEMQEEEAMFWRKWNNIHKITKTANNEKRFLVRWNRHKRENGRDCKPDSCFLHLTAKKPKKYGVSPCVPMGNRV